jgi:uncharacterized protein YjbI with pentapeptide repeats
MATDIRIQGGIVMIKHRSGPQVAACLLAEYQTGRRNFSLKKKMNDLLAAIEGPDLSGADLCNARLKWIVLTGANLFCANLSGACLARAELVRADCQSANLTNADLSYANLCHADLTNADLKCADLSNAILIGANLTGADLRGVKYAGADFTGAILQDAKISPALARMVTETVMVDYESMHQNFMPEATIEG